MKSTVLAVALTSLFSGITVISATTADGAALLVSDARSVTVDAMLTDAAGASDFADQRSHAGVGGAFDAYVWGDQTSPDGAIHAYADASQRSTVSLDGAGRLLGIDVADLGANLLLEDDGFGVSSAVQAVSRLELVFDVLQATQVTYRGLEPWFGETTFSITGSDDRVHAAGLSLTDAVVTLDAGRYTLLFEADVEPFGGSMQGGNGYLTASFTTPEPGTAALLLTAVGAVVARRRRCAA